MFRFYDIIIVQGKGNFRCIFKSNCVNNYIRHIFCFFVNNDRSGLEFIKSIDKINFIVYNDNGRCVTLSTSQLRRVTV